MRTLLDLLKLFEPYVVRQDNEGYQDCPLCDASGWGFIEHEVKCPVREARILLGKCPHGFPGGYNHGGGPCQIKSTGKVA